MAKEKNEIMITHVNEWKLSGMTMRAYAELKGMSTNKLEYWIRKLRTTHGKNYRDSQFIQIGSLIEDSDFTINTSEKSRSTDPQLELTFSNGLCLKIYK